MTETSTEVHQTAILGLFAHNKSAEGRIKAGDLKKKLGRVVKDGADVAEIDRAIAGIIEQGLITVVGGSKEGHHPRPNATYRLTDQGKHHLRPARPEHSDEMLRYQEAFILLQVFRAKEQKLTRSELNGKLKTVAAVGQLEFDVKGTPETVEYHLAALVEKGGLDEQRRGVSVVYTLNPERGAAALASAHQHQAVSFTMSGATLNALLEAAKGAAPSQATVDEPSGPTPVPSVASLGADDIAKYVEQLRADKYAGKGLIPIHEVRQLVAKNHGQEAAGHPTFDPILKRMRSDGQLELIAISDNRRATQEELDASIPGMNETIFYIVVE